MLKNISLISMIIFLTSCASWQSPFSEDLQTNSNEIIYWVNSVKVPCAGVGSLQCLQVQKNSSIAPNAWQNFYQSIAGFNFEPGFIYQIKIKQEEMPKEQLPADSSKYRYQLIKILDKKPDPKFAINGSWQLSELVAHNILFTDFAKAPQLTINLLENRISGRDGCNNFVGGIAQVDDKNLTFTQLGVTRKMCFGITIPDLFYKEFEQTKMYVVKNEELSLLDGLGKVLLKFQKLK